MSNGLMISAWALSAQGSEINQDNVYLNGHFFTPDVNEEVISYSKASNVEFQMYGVCDGDAQGDTNCAPAYTVMQRMQHLQSVLSMDGTVTRDKIWSFLCDTNDRIRDLQNASGNPEISSTFAGLFLQKNRGLAVHLGDSRIYVIRGGRMLQITEDHLEANDLYKLGVITQQQAEVHKLKSKPTAKLGMRDIYEAEASVFSKYFVFYPGDIFLICTDGITDSISNAAIERTIAGIQDPAEIAETLLRMTFNKNQDNKSIVVLHVDEVDGEMAPVREVAGAAVVEDTVEEPQEEENYEESVEEEPVQDAYDYEEEGEAAYEEADEAEAEYDEGAEDADVDAEIDYDDDDVEDEEDEEDEEPAKKSLDLRGKLAALAAKMGAKKNAKPDDETDDEEESDEEESDEEVTDEDGSEEESEDQEKEEKSPKKVLGAFLGRFTKKSSDEETDAEDEEESDADEEYKDETDPVKAEAEEKPESFDEDEEGEDEEDDEEKKSPILGAFAFLKGKFAKKEASDAEDESDEEKTESNDAEENEDEELSILDKIFADPKKILGILAGIVVLIVLIVLLSTKGCKSGSGDVSSVEESSVVEESSEEESSEEESSEEESSVEESSVVEESSEPEITGYVKTEDEGKKDHPTDLPEESSYEESSEEESSEEESYYEESSVYYPPEESSVYYPPTPPESSYVDPVKYVTIEEGGYVTYWDIIIDYYGEWSDDLYRAFCEYNGIEVDSPLSFGQVLSIPPISYLNL